jgi:hypothetical protein
LFTNVTKCAREFVHCKKFMMQKIHGISAGFACQI